MKGGQQAVLDRSLLEAVCDPGAVRALLAAGANPNAVLDDDDGVNTPLVEAALRVEAETVSTLLAAGADPNGRDEYGATALHEAARRATVEVLGPLLAAGADPNARDGEGAREGAVQDRPAVAALLAAGADVNARDGQGMTPLDLARRHRHLAAAAARLEAAGGRARLGKA